MHHSMPDTPLRIHTECPAPAGTMILAFSGWMDGGDVSTGTVERMIELLDAQPVADIDPDGFYILNMPGSMEVSALFRPEIDITDGRIDSLDMPTASFYHSGEHRVLALVAKEPNLRWRPFGDAIFELARRAGIKTLLFVGSFGGLVPHTREPRLYMTVSDESLLEEYGRYGLQPSNYEGPGSFTTYLINRAPEEGVDMVSIVAEIPGYLQGTNPASIEAVTRRLAKILSLDLDLAGLRAASTQWEIKVSEAVDEDEELAQKVRELEEQYDDQLIETQADADPDEG